MNSVLFGQTVKFPNVKKAFPVRVFDFKKEAKQ